MFIKQVCGRVLVFNQEMKLVSEYEDCVFVQKDDRVLIMSSDHKRVFCDMPKENTFILY